MSIQEIEFAKKKFGQNFLVNKGMQTKITNKFIELVNTLDSTTQVIEIGPGRGDLSKYLLGFGDRLTMIEIDPESIEYIEKTLDLGDSKIILGDAYDQLSIQNNIYPTEFALFSNLPFNVGSRIMVDLAIYRPNTYFGVILQKEVASKIKKSTNITFFGAWLNLFWDLKVCFDVSKGNFSPSPRVTSSYIQGIPTGFLTDLSRSLLAKDILKSLFAMPNKTISNNLKKYGMNSQEISKFFTDNKLDKNTRLEWGNYKEILVKLIDYVEQIKK